MSIRTLDDLSRTVRDDLGYRRKELHFYDALVARAEPQNKQAVLRGAVAVLYAHWEGFVKCALQNYIEFVRAQRHLVRDLTDPFVAMAARKHLDILAVSNRPQVQIDAVRWFRDEWGSRAFLPNRSIVSAQSNLSVEVFRDLMCKLGLEYRSEYALAEKPVIERLLSLRNGLAHGEWNVIDESEWREQLYRRVVQLIEVLCDQVDTAALSGAYRRPEKE